MKKPYVYAMIIAALVLFAALATVYQMKNPGRMIPEQKYTEEKARLLTANYLPAAKELEIEENKRGSTVFAAAVEYPTKEREKSEGVTAEFYLFDLMNKYAHLLSSGDAEITARHKTDNPSTLTKKAAELYDDSFSEAGNSDYGIPDYGTVKLYIRRGDGVYYKVYDEKDFPSEITKLIYETDAAGDKNSDTAE